MKQKSFKKALLLFFTIMLVYYALFYIPLPYYISQPGSAEELDQYVSVEDGYDELGEFMFTTVSIGQATPFWLLVGAIMPYYEVEKKESILLEGESDEDYNNRQEHYMSTAQEKAIYNAYSNANKEVEKTFDGIYVMYVYEDMPANGLLKTGDIIVAIDGKKITSTDMFMLAVDEKEVGDYVAFSVKRGEDKFEVEIPLKEFSENSGKKGIGISFEEEVSVTESPKTTFSLQNVGGPSAGLMFTLEIFNQLNEEDYTKGYKIAGTGTIDYDGTVGPIGGISQKIVAADEEGAEIFFAPNEENSDDSNYKEAVQTAKDIDTNMIIVPVDNVSDAIEYLEKLEEK